MHHAGNPDLVVEKHVHDSVPIKVSKEKLHHREISHRNYEDGQHQYQNGQVDLQDLVRSLILGEDVVKDKEEEGEKHCGVCKFLALGFSILAQ